MYPGTQHGFHNDTTPRYDKAAAALAWQRTIDFFNKQPARGRRKARGEEARALGAPGPDCYPK